MSKSNNINVEYNETYCRIQEVSKEDSFPGTRKNILDATPNFTPH